MANVRTEDLLTFQDYSPEHNDRSARIEVEAVHTNQYNNANQNYNYEEPKTAVDDDDKSAPPQTNHNFWTIEYYQKYFDVQSSEVVDRIISSVIPTKVPRNFFDERIQGKPDLYGPVWISVTLATTTHARAAATKAEGIKHRTYRNITGDYIFTPIAFETMDSWGSEAKIFIGDLSARLIDATGDRRAGSFFAQRLSLIVQRGNAASILATMPHGDALEEIFAIAISGNISSYLQNANQTLHWRYDFHLVSYAATAIISYVWIIPLALWAALKFTTTEDAQNDMESQASSSPKMMALFCLYGYSLSIYIPVAILWSIQVSWLQWLLVLMAAFVSGAVLIFWLLPALRKSKYFIILVVSILAFHFLLAAGFKVYFFHSPVTAVVAEVVTTTLKPV